MPKHRYLRALAALFSATVVGQLLTLATLPLLTRWLGAEQYGFFTLFMAVLLLLAPLVTLNLPQALMLARTRRQVSYLSVLSLAVAWRFCLGLSLLMLLVYLLQPLAPPGGVGLWLLLPLLLLLNAVWQVQQQRLLRLKAFGQLARSEAVYAASFTAAKLVAAFYWPVASLLALAAALSRLQQLFLLQRLHPLRLSPFRALFSFKQHLVPRLVKYKEFALYQTPQLWLNAIAQQSPLLFFAAYQGAASAAFYALAKTVLEAPATLVNKVVADVFYPFIAERHAQAKPLLPLFAGTTLALAVVAAIPFLLIGLYAVPIFTLVFGSSWQTAGEIASYLALWCFLIFCNAPAGRVVVVCRLQLAALYLNAVTTLLRLVALYCSLAWFSNMLLAVQLLTLLGVLHNSAFIALACFACYRHDSAIKRK